MIYTKRSYAATIQKQPENCFASWAEETDNSQDNSSCKDSDWQLSLQFKRLYTPQLLFIIAPVNHRTATMNRAHAYVPADCKPKPCYCVQYLISYITSCVKMPHKWHKFQDVTVPNTTINKVQQVSLLDKNEPIKQPSAH
jgi:hypothetical protein